MPRPRLTAALALIAAALLAAPAAAAPRGVTFADPAGDANGLDGRAPAGSQAAFDIVRVRLSPYERAGGTSGVAIRIDLAAAPSTAPGSSYVFTAKQAGCDITVSRTATTDGVAGSTFVACRPVVGGYHTSTTPTGLVTGGRSLTFAVPAGALPNAAIGAALTNVEVGTATGEPVSGFAAPASINRAAYPKPYRLGS